MRTIYGCAGPTLSADEQAFYKEAQPWGFILFGRNIVDREQLRSLVSSLRETVGDPRAPVLIDQEGGRVARLKPPEWKARLPAARFGALHEVATEAAHEAVYLHARLIAHDLAELGINVDCAPVLDLPVEGAHDVIGDRAFSRDPAIVVDLGRQFIQGLIEGGVLPVMKHMPGHGRATADTHLALPHIDTPRQELSMTDFVTFRGLAGCPLGMTAHVVIDDVDPRRPATTSTRVIRQVIRDEIGFEGLLMTDDISMNALDGSIAARTKAALFAGCDIVLHCNGDMAEMRDVAKEAKPLEKTSLKRAEAALSQIVTPGDFDVLAGETRLAELLETVA
jgi:beta-N-acetylhexosaminidase